MGFPLLPGDGERETTRVLEPHGREALELLERVLPEERLRDRRLQVARLGLDRLLADLREAPLLVDHAALLPAHSERAGLAGVARAQAPVEPPQAAGLSSLAKGVA